MAGENSVYVLPQGLCSSGYRSPARPIKQTMTDLSMGRKRRAAAWRAGRPKRRRPAYVRHTSMVLLRRGSTCASGHISCYAKTSKRADVPLYVNALVVRTSPCEVSIEQASYLSALLRWDC